MCKHILFNDFRMKDIETLKTFIEMTYDNDGFGAIVRTEDNKIEMLKSLSKGVFYIELMERIYCGDVKTLVVHHRTSTNLPGIAYAHPFEFQGNYLTHNGVVSVPGTHKTATENDSEKLLHHLITTKFETLSIQGYFSCFILNQSETIVLVDNKAPIYTDGRVYSSHDLGKSFSKIELKLLKLNPGDGEILSTTDIKVTESTYGQSLASKSLGKGLLVDDSEWEGYRDDDYLDSFLSNNVRDFYDCISDKELEELQTTRDKSEAKMLICEVGMAIGLDLTNSDINRIYDFLDFNDVA